VFTVILAAVLGQAGAVTAAETNDLARIRKALAEPAPVFLTTASVGRHGPVFRMRIQGFDLADAWDDRSIVPPYVRPWFRLYHHEYLEQVTPVEFRGATLHPYGLPLDRIVGYLVKELKAARRASQERRARDQVTRELAAFLTCRSDSSKPDC